MMGVTAVLLGTIFAIVLIATAWQYRLTLQRLFGRHRQPYLDIATATWPRIAVFLPCRDEQEIGPLMVALLAADYPAGMMVIIPIVDPAFPETARVLDDYAVRFAGRVIPFHRARRDGGRAGALREASEHAVGREAAIHLVFDGAYRPGRGLIKQLVAPFFDPEVGAVFGRILPDNPGRGLLPRLLALGEAADSQIEQQARTDRAMTPEISAPVAGIRRTALLGSGGWIDDAASETLELGYRLARSGWEVVYQNRAECYQRFPEDWGEYQTQVRRAARGRLGTLARHGMRAGLDGVVRLSRPLVAGLIFAGWAVALTASYSGYPAAVIAFAGFTVLLYSGEGRCLSFLAAAAAARLDGTRERVRMLPLLGLSGLSTMASTVTGALLALISGLGRPNRRTRRAALPPQAPLAAPSGKGAQ